MTTPPPARRMSRAAVCIMNVAAFTFTSNILSKASAVDVVDRPALGIACGIDQHIDTAKGGEQQDRNCSLRRVRAVRSAARMAHLSLPRAACVAASPSALRSTRTQPVKSMGEIGTRNSGPQALCTAGDDCHACHFFLWFFFWFSCCTMRKRPRCVKHRSQLKSAVRSSSVGECDAGALGPITVHQRIELCGVGQDAGAHNHAMPGGRGS